MKRLLFAMLAVYGLIGYQGCKKDVPEPIDLKKLFQQPVIRPDMPWTINNGTLVFLDNDHLVQGLGILADLSTNERAAWEDSMGFLSLQRIEDIVNQAELDHQALFFAGVSDSLTDEEYRAMGYQPSSLYQTYEQAGVIETINEPDSSWSFEIRIHDESMWHVLNEQGEVIVGDTRFVYHDSIRDSYSLSTGQLIESIQVGKQAASLTNFDRHWHIGGASEPFRKWSWLKPCGSKKRFAAKMQYFCGYDGEGVAINFRFKVKAQRKKNGIWARRNDYKPFISASGTWGYRYTLEIYKTGEVINWTDQQGQLIDYGYLKSPMNFNVNGDNKCSAKLHPSGYQWSPFVRFLDNVELLNPSFTFRFEGCPSQLVYTIP